MMGIIDILNRGAIKSIQKGSGNATISTINAAKSIILPTTYLASVATTGSYYATLAVSNTAVSGASIPYANPINVGWVVIEFY